MLHLLIKFFASALIISLVSELAKKSPLLGAVTVSLPIISIMTLTWLYVDTRSTGAIIALCHDLFWLTIPGLSIFLLLPAFLRLHWPFASSLAASLICTIGIYLIFILIKKKIGF